MPHFMYKDKDRNRLKSTLFFCSPWNVKKSQLWAHFTLWCHIRKLTHPTVECLQKWPHCKKSVQGTVVYMCSVCWIDNTPGEGLKDPFTACHKSGCIKHGIQRNWPPSTVRKNIFGKIIISGNIHTVDEWTEILNWYMTYIPPLSMIIH